MLRHFDVSMITHPRFQRFALDIAKKYNIPVQESVRRGEEPMEEFLIHAIFLPLSLVFLHVMRIPLQLYKHAGL